MESDLNCPACGFANPPEARFCAGCGQAVARACPACGTALAAGARFCFQCGAAVDAPPPAAPAAPSPAADRDSGDDGAERRMVTILFADIVGSTSMGEQHDPEDVADLMGRALAAMTRAVEAAGGTVGRLMGDGMLAFFGAPISHEDDPLRAVRAALAIRAAIGDLSSALEADGRARLQVRVGLNSGLVVVGQFGSDVFREYTTMGDAANTAARMQSAAGPDEVYVSAATAELLRHAVVLEPVGPLTLKGKAEPVPAFRVVGDAPELGASTRGLEGRTAPLIGRDAELARLLAWYDDVSAAGRLAWITVVGDAGIGKSRLTQALVDAVGAREPAPTVLRARALEQAGDAYSLLRDLLAKRYAPGEGAGGRPALGRAELAAALAADLAGAPHLDAAAAARDLAAVVVSGGDGRDPRGQAERAAAALTALLRTLVERGPLVLVFEDLHWADDASLDRIADLVDGLADAPVLIVGNARPTLYARRPHWGEGEAAHQRLDLGQLTPAALELLLGALLDTDRVPPPVRDFVLSRGEGNPYYVEELVHMLVVRGVATRADGGWQIEGGALQGDAVPTTLAGMLQAHLDALTPDQKRLLQRASVYGREFWTAAVAALGAVDPADLEALRRSGLVVARGRSTFAGEQEFLFKHALLRDAAYGSILKRQRPPLHAAAADWLAAAAGDRYPALAAQIAAHCLSADRPLAAAHHLGAAGDRERQAYANDSAVAAYSRALELWSTADEVPPSERAGAAGVPAGVDAPAARFACLRGRELVRDTLADRDGQRADLDAMAALTHGLGDAARSYVHFRRSWLAQRLGDGERALAEARAALDSAGDDPHARADALVNLGNALLMTASPADAEAPFREAVQGFDQLGDPAAAANAWLGVARACRAGGRPADAERGTANALALYRDVGDLVGQAATLMVQAVTHGMQGDLDAAEPLLRDAHRLYRQAGERDGEGMALHNLGFLSKERGDLPAAREHLVAAAAVFRATRNAPSVALVYDDLADVAAALGDDAAAESARRDAAAARAAPRRR